MPRLYVPAASIPSLGEVRFGGRVGVGEVSFELACDVRKGRWRAFYLDEDALDDLVEKGMLPDLEEVDLATQLLLVHAERGLPTEQEMADLRETGRVSIEGARVTIADATLEPALSADSAFDDYLDGVHGTLRDGNGVTLMLSGDASASVWADAADSASVLFVEIR